MCTSQPEGVRLVKKNRSESHLHSNGRCGMFVMEEISWSEKDRCWTEACRNPALSSTCLISIAMQIKHKTSDPRPSVHYTLHLMLFVNKKTCQSGSYFVLQGSVAVDEREEKITGVQPSLYIQNSGFIMHLQFSVFPIIHITAV